MQLGPTYTGNVPECKNCQNLLGGGSSSQADTQSAQVQTQKHIYVFAAADDEEEQPQQQQQIAPAQKQVHYKIIFIKAPNYDRARQQILAQQAQVSHPSPL